MEKNIIYWEWQEFKDNQGNVQEIRFQKKCNVPQGTEKIVRYLHWDSKAGKIIPIVKPMVITMLLHLVVDQPKPSQFSRYMKVIMRPGLTAIA